MNKKELMYPNMHDEAIHYMKYLSDINYQERVWRDFDFSGMILPFEDIFHFFFDDTHLSSNIDDCVGMFLRDANEAACISAVIREIDDIHKKYGLAMESGEYITKPEWQKVLTRAKAALNVLSAPDAPDDGPASP